MSFKNPITGYLGYFPSKVKRAAISEGKRSNLHSLKLCFNYGGTRIFVLDYGSLGLKHPLDTSSCAFKHFASIFPQNDVLGRSQPWHLRDLVRVWPGLATSYLASPHFHFLLARALAHDHQRNHNKNSPGTCVYWKLPPLLLCPRPNFILPPRS